MNKTLRMMHLLRDVTRAGGLCWHETDDYTYEAESGGEQFMIRFKFPMMATDEGSDPDVAEVHLPGLTLTFYNGTEGFDLILEALAGATKERQRGHAVFVQRAENLVKLLEGILARSPGTVSSPDH